MIAVASALSRVTGLLRIVIAASLLGATVLGDLFIAVNVLPLIVYDVFAGSAISSVLVPPLVRFLERGHVERARRFIGNYLGLLVLFMVAVAEVAIIGRSWIASALTSGVEDALATDAGRVAGLLVLMIVPQIVLYAAIGVFVSVQHAHRRFLVPSAAPIIENLGLIATVTFAWLRYGGGREVTDAPTGLIVVLGVGSGLSVTAHALIQYVGARRAGGRLRIGADWRDPSIKKLAGPTRDSFGWSGVIAARQFALIVAAGFAGAGAVQAFEIATLAYFIPVALIGRPIASAALPRLAKARAGGGQASERLLFGYLASLRLAAWMAVPAGLTMVLLASPLAEAVARGRFDDPAATRMLTFGLIGLGLGAAAEALFEIARQATMAHGQAAGLRRSTWIRAGVAAVGIPLAVVLLDGPAVLLGLGLAVSLGDLAAFAVAHRALRSHHDWPTDNTTYWPRIVLASILAIAPVALLTRGAAGLGDTLRLAMVVAAVAALYGAAVFLVSGRGRLIRSLGSMLAQEELA